MVDALAMQLRDAVERHRAGALDDARVRYDAILAIDPDYFDALHLKGVVFAQQDRAEEAVALMRRAIAIRPDHSGAFGNLGGLLLRLGRAEEALACFDSLSMLQPDHAGTHGARAHALHRLGRLGEAVAAYDRALALKPDDAEAWSNRGNALQAMGRAAEALASHDRAVALRPAHADAIYGQGNALQALGRTAEALARYEAAIAAQPRHAEAHSSRGNALRRLGRLDEALASHERAVVLKPASADAHSNHAAALVALGRFDDALAAYDRALARKPDHAHALAGRAGALAELDRLDDALADCRRALALMPDDADTWSRHGLVLQGLMRLDEALASYDRAIALDPAHVDAAWNRANALLLSGDLARGWPAFEMRWRVLGRGAPGTWLGGMPIAGRPILLRAEQGLGDTIQFARYAPMVRALGARVTLQVQPPLARLMATLDAGIEIATAPVAAALDCPLMSLPLAFGTTLDTIPAPARYLAAEPAAVATWRARLDAHAGPHVGLVWSGNPAHRNDRSRSVPLAALRPLLDLDVHVVALQKDVTAADAALCEAMGVTRVDGELRDFADTAALIEALDLVVAVDTSVAHLAGALGRPVWILLPFSPDWRWLAGRDDSPWYPSARLFRQEMRGDWQGVVHRLCAAISRGEVGGAS